LTTSYDETTNKQTNKQTDFATSNTFKTEDTYLAQSVILGNDSVKQLVEMYLDRVRPLVAPENEDTNTAMLILNWKGVWDKRLDRHVTNFYSKMLHLNITSTTIRQMMETTALDYRLRGILSEEHLDAVHHVVGHSETTAKEFYIL
jgi:hypothetical protein